MRIAKTLVTFRSISYMKPRWWLTFPTRVKWKIEHLRLNPILVARWRRASNDKCSYLALSESDV